KCSSEAFLDRLTTPVIDPTSPSGSVSASPSSPLSASPSPLQSPLSEINSPRTHSHSEIKGISPQTVSSRIRITNRHTKSLSSESHFEGGSKKLHSGEGS